MADVTKTVSVIVKASTDSLTGGLGKGQDAFKKLLNIGKMAIAGIAAAFAAFAVKFLIDSAKIGAAFEQTMAEVGAVGKLTAEQLGAVSDKARAIGAATAFTATEAGKGFILLARAGLDANQQIGAIDATMKLAGATATSMETSTSGMVATLAQFNLAVEQSSRVADVFAAAASGSLFNVEELTVAMRYGGTAAGAMGIDLESATAALMMFRNLGLEASQAGTTYRMALIQLSTQSAKNTEILKGLGLTYEDVNPQTHEFGEIIQTLADKGMNASTAMAFFGSRAGAGMAALINNAKQGRNEFDEFSNTLRESAGTADEMYSRMMDTVEGQSKIMKSAIEEIKLAIFDTFKTELKEGYSSAASIFQSIGNLIKNNLPLFRQIVSQIKVMFTAMKVGKGDVDILKFAISAAGNVIIILLGAISSSLNMVKLIWVRVKRAFIVVTDLILMSFNSILKAIIATVDTAGKAIGFFSKETGKKITDSISGLRTFSNGISVGIKEDFTNAVNDGKDAIDGMKESTDGWGKSLAAWNSINWNATNSTTEAVENLGGVIQSTTENMEDSIESVSAETESYIDDIKDMEYQLGKLSYQEYKSYLVAKMEALRESNEEEYLQKLQLQQKIAGLDEEERKRLQELNKERIELVARLDEALLNAALNMRYFGLSGQAVFDIMKNTFESVENGLSSLVMDIVEGTKSMGNALKDFVTGITKSMLKMITQVLAKMAIMATIKAIFGGATGGLGLLAMKAVGFASGGLVHGSGYGDSVPAMLTPGEFVVRRDVAQSPGMLDYLQRLNTQESGEKNISFNLSGMSRNERELYIRDLRPGGALNEAFRHLGGKVVLGGI